MLTHRSFLAFAAAAQLLSPVARAMQVRDGRPMAQRLPKVSLQTHAGRDIYFCNDPMSGRLAILNLQYADTDTLCLPPARRSPAGGEEQAYLYSLTLQPAVNDPVALRRYMERYGTGSAWPGLAGAPHEIELVRLRLGMYSGG
jgi:protein SCO1/2